MADTVMKRCGICDTGYLKRCGRTGVDEYFLSLGGIYPHKCGYCRQKSYAFLWVKCLPTALCLLVLLAAAVAGVYALRLRSSASQARASVRRVHPESRRSSAGRWQTIDNKAVLDNQSVVSMSKTQISARTLIRAIERSPCRFDMSASAIIRMRSNGVPDEVIYAMLSGLDQCEPVPDAVSIDPVVKNNLSSAIVDQIAAPVE